MSDKSFVDLSGNSLVNINLEKLPDSVDKSIGNLTNDGSYWVGKIIGAAAKFVYATVGKRLDIYSERTLEKLEEFKKEAVEQINNIPLERRIEPSIDVVNSIVDGVGFCLDEDELRTGFANLLAASVDSKRKNGLLKVHAQILKSLCSDEAKILCVLAEYFVYGFVSIAKGDTANGMNVVVLRQLFTNLGDVAGCKERELTSSYIKHLEVLGLIEIKDIERLSDAHAYEEIKNMDEFKRIERHIEEEGKKIMVTEGVVRITDLGLNFVKSCGLLV